MLLFAIFRPINMPMTHSSVIRGPDSKCNPSGSLLSFILSPHCLVLHLLWLASGLLFPSNSLVCPLTSPCSLWGNSPTFWRSFWHDLAGLVSLPSSHEWRHYCSPGHILSCKWALCSCPLPILDKKFLFLWIYCHLGSFSPKVQVLSSIFLMKLDRVENRVYYLQIIRVKCCFEELVFQIHTQIHMYILGCDIKGISFCGLRFKKFGNQGYAFCILNFWLITFIKISCVLLKPFHFRCPLQTVWRLGPQGWPAQCPSLPARWLPPSAHPPSLWYFTCGGIQSFFSKHCTILS